MDVIDEIFVYDTPTLSLKSVYKNNNVDISTLAKKLPSDAICEDVDNSISTLIAQVIILKKALKTPKKVKQYIRAVLIETEQCKLKELT